MRSRPVKEIAAAIVALQEPDQIRKAMFCLVLAPYREPKLRELDIIQGAYVRGAFPLQPEVIRDK